MCMQDSVNLQLPVLFENEYSMEHVSLFYSLK